MTLATAGINPVTYDSPASIATGTFTGDGSTTAAINLGFTPKYFKLFNITDVLSWEWVQGMAATKTIYFTGAADMAVDTNTVVATNGKLTSTTQVGVYAPGTQSADGGTLTNTTLSVYGQDHSLSYVCQLTTNGLVNAKLYVWVAIG